MAWASLEGARLHIADNTVHFSDDILGYILHAVCRVCMGDYQQQNFFCRVRSCDKVAIQPNLSAFY